MSLMDKLKQKMGMDPITLNVSKLLAPLSETHLLIYEKSRNFIIKASDEDVLLQVAQLDSNNFIEAFGNIASSHYLDWKKSNSAVEGRYALYKLAEENQCPPDVLIRMAKLLAELLHDKIEKHTQDDFPDWLHILLTDWQYSIKSPRKKRYPYADDIKTSNYSIRLHNKVCEAAKLHPAYWLLYIFDRRNVDSYWGMETYVFNYNTMPDCRSLMIEQQTYLKNEVYPNLNPKAKADCLAFIAKQDLIETYQGFIISQSVDKSKLVRNQAAMLLPHFHPDNILNGLSQFLLKGNALQRKESANLLGQFCREKAAPLFQQAIKVEKSQAQIALLEMLLGMHASESEAKSSAQLNLPEYEALPDTNTVSDELTNQIYKSIQKLQEKHKDMPEEHKWERERKREIMTLSKGTAEYVVRVFNGQDAPSANFNFMNQYVNWKELLKDPSIELVNVLHFYEQDKENAVRRRSQLSYGPLRDWLAVNPSRLPDLRALNDLLVKLGWPQDTVFSEVTGDYWRKSFLLEYLPKDYVWPYFAQLEDQLISMLKDAGNDYKTKGCLDRVYEVLDTFPSLSLALESQILTVALAESKTYRARAQTLLSDVDGITDKIVHALKSGAQEVRINAARWLAKISENSAIPALQEALKKEKREAVKATLLASLESLGEDISSLLTPAKLLKEAKVGLSKKIPTSLEWFPFEGLPALSWQNGSKVNPEITKWWIVLACKLKDPTGNGLFLNYLKLLTKESAQRYGSFVLQSFVAQDTRRKSRADAETFAQQNGQGRLASYQHWAQYEWGEQYKNKTFDDAIAEIIQEQMGIYLGSIIKDKGILAVCALMDGNESVATIRHYMKDHYTRRAQIESFLKAITPGNDPLFIQFLLSVSRRYRTRSVQELARELIEQIARQNGWSQEQLADRTLPTAGFSQNGELQLDYGTRQFLVKLDAKMKPVLFNESGKVIKSLPQARQADNPEVIKEAKANFSSCKKELKQVISLTTGRYYEAMCAQRFWQAAEWQEFIFEHPLANRLAQGLVWLWKQDDQQALFRITEDGALIDAEDEEVELATSGEICIAHSAVVSEDTRKDWLAHFKDYKVNPLLQQFKTTSRMPEFKDDTVKFEKYNGYLSDSFTFRGIFTKLGYKRGEAEDAGFFYTYHKEFSSMDIDMTITFSGNCLPEENVPAALQYLCFSRHNTNQGWVDESRLLPLNSIPPILLLEAMSDLETIAAKTGGFDPDWEKKVPW